jgi:hypothetical protein
LNWVNDFEQPHDENDVDDDAAAADDYNVKMMMIKRWLDKRWRLPLVECRENNFCRNIKRNCSIAHGLQLVRLFMTSSDTSKPNFLKTFLLRQNTLIISFHQVL